ncbi:MAG: copper chaperone PCu(A)C [Actinomycetia bacterium]|nr:copper chaperone PCu(A)C [Actinomycetes bacterium]
MTRLARFAAPAALTLGTIAWGSACGSVANGGVEASNAAVGANPGDSAALYVDLSNTGNADDSLVAAECDCAGTTSLHVTEDRDGILLMLGADSVTLPAHETTSLHPGGTHVMLEGLAQPLEAGQQVDVTLEFADSEPITLEAPVVPLQELAERVPQR